SHRARCPDGSRACGRAGWRRSPRPRTAPRSPRSSRCSAPRSTWWRCASPAAVCRATRPTCWSRRCCPTSPPWTTTARRRRSKRDAPRSSAWARFSTRSSAEARVELTLSIAAAVLGAALLHAAWNTLIKASADKELDTYAVAACCGLIAVLFVCGGIVAFASGAHDRRATAFALANAAVIGAYTLIDAKGVRASDEAASYTLWFFAANAIVIAAMGMLRRGSAVPRYLGQNWRRALLGGACSVGAYAIALWAMTRAPVALVAVLRETSVIFAAVLAALVLKEKLTRRRLFATGAVLAGLILLRI